MESHVVQKTSIIHTKLNRHKNARCDHEKLDTGYTGDAGKNREEDEWGACVNELEHHVGGNEGRDEVLYVQI